MMLIALVGKFAQKLARMLTKLQRGMYYNNTLLPFRITCNGGFGLIIDYGHLGARDTLSLRAYSRHKQVCYCFALYH